jgi:hypothetical protein
LQYIDPFRSLICGSHAHEGELPGTVDLNAAEGDDTGYGQALFPVPADDPNDPLQVGGYLSVMLKGKNLIRE